MNNIHPILEREQDTPHDDYRERLVKIAAIAVAAAEAWDRTNGILDSDGKQIRANGFRHVGPITKEYGAWLLGSAKELEASPPGSVNLWNMMGVNATPETE